MGAAGWLAWRVYGSSVTSADMTSDPTKLGALLDAIQHFEGGNPGDLNMRNNNPGNLKFANQAGATGADSRGFAIFPDYATGRDALAAQISLDLKRNPNQTLLDFISKYSPATDSNNPLAYASYVAKKLGASITDSLSSILG